VTFEIRTSIDGEVLVVTILGEASPANARDIASRYIETVLISGRKKVLADIRPLHGRLPAGALYFFMRELPAVSLPPRIVTAVLDREENEEFVTFLETTSTNAGLHLRGFVRPESALAWIRSQA